MLTSPEGGERAVAAKLLTEAFARLGITWDDVIDRATSIRSAPKPPPSAHRTTQSAPRTYERKQRFKTWRTIDAEQVVAFFQDHDHQLSNWERNFVSSLAQQGPRQGFTEKQWEVVLQIGARHGWVSKAA